MSNVGMGQSFEQRDPGTCSWCCQEVEGLRGGAKLQEESQTVRQTKGSLGSLTSFSGYLSRRILELETSMCYRLLRVTLFRRSNKLNSYVITPKEISNKGTRRHGDASERL